MARGQDEKRRRRSLPYKAYEYARGVDFLQRHGYPTFGYLSGFLDSHSTVWRPGKASSPPNSSRIALVDFLESGEVRQSDFQGGKARFMKDDDDLVDLIQAELRGDQIGRGLIGQILVVEDLSPNIANCLGYALDIHPGFFAGHIRDTWMETGTRLGNAPPLPSVAKDRNFFSLDYMSAVLLKPLSSLENTYIRCCYNYRRRVDLAGVDTNSRVGMARRKISFWLDEREPRPWLCIVLVDPPIGPRFRTSWDKTFKLDAAPFQQGYIDFMEPEMHHGRPAYYRDDPTKKLSPLDDLIHHWTQYHRDRVCDLRRLDKIAIMRPAFQIIASELVVSLEAMKASLNLGLENYLTECTYMDRILAARARQVEIMKQIINDEESALYLDYEYLETEMRSLRETVSARLNAITNMISLLDSRLAGRLSWAALIFAPLAFACSIFSMDGDFAPGSRLFWLYWVIAALFVVIVLVVLYGLQWLLPIIRRRIRDIKQNTRQLKDDIENGGHYSRSPGSRHPTNRTRSAQPAHPLEGSGAATPTAQTVD